MLIARRGNERSHYDLFKDFGLRASLPLTETLPTPTPAVDLNTFSFFVRRLDSRMVATIRYSE